MEIVTLHHVGLKVDDLEDARRFYTGALGMTARTDRPSSLPPGLWLDAGDRRINLAPADQGPGAAHFALVVADMDASIERLRASGVAVPTQAEPLNFMFQDPSGNWIELRQPADRWARHFA